MTTTPRPSIFRLLLDKIERVHPSLVGEERIRSGLLARLLLISIIIGSLFMALTISLFPEQLRALDTQMILIGLLCLPTYYLMNRAGRYSFAYHAFVITILVVFLVPTYVKGSSPASLAMTALGYLMAGIFFNGRDFIITIVAGSLWVGANIALNATNPDSAVPERFISYITVWAFLVMMGALVATFVNYLREAEARRRHELEVANERLRESERTLEQRVAERTRELAAARDDAQAAQQRAEQADRLKSQFLASMSHELRTPLNSILNFSEFLNMGVLGDVSEDQQQALTSITDSGHHLLALINDVLDISKIQAGMLKLNIEHDIDLTKEINAVIESGRALIGEKPVELRVEVEPNLPRVQGDRRRIRQILLNLMSNAAKFTEEGSITFTAARRADEVRFSIIDTGPGIQPEEQTRLFQPFVQTESGVKHTGGTGLGLAISKALVDAHHGEIGFASTPGVSTAFFVQLPIRFAAQTELIAEVSS